MNVEPMDIVLGLVAAILIPVATVVILNLIGLPPSGKAPETWEESLAKKEQKKTRKPPPFDKQEYRARLERCRTLLNNYVPKYRNLAHQEKESVPKHNYWDAAKKCLEMAEAELKLLMDNVRRSPDLRDRESQVSAEQTRISEIRHELNQERVFIRG